MIRLQRTCQAFLVFAISGVSVVSGAGAQTIDPHRVYEQRCGNCHHEHGADLARLKFAMKDGKLQVERTGKDVSGLLRSHHGVRLSAEETAALVTLFEAALASGGVYQHRCARCHERAVTFARSKLIMRDGQVRTLDGDRDVALLLKDHGGATESEIDVLIEMLKRQLQTQEK
jgi:hypothetical protein